MTDKIQIFLNNPSLLKALEAEEIAFATAQESAAKSEYADNNIKAQDWFNSLADFLQEYENAEFQNFSRGAQVFSRLRLLMEHFAAGELPDPVRLGSGLITRI